EDRNVATSAPQNTKTNTSRVRSKRKGGLTRARIRAAPINASLQLLRYQPRTSVVGKPLFSSTARCAGSAARSRNHHQLVGASTRAASIIVLGGHRVETGTGRRVRAKPSLAPT